MKRSKSPLLPLWQSLAWIIASIFFVTGPSYLGFKWTLEKRREALRNPQFAIRWIIQTGPQRQALTTECLAEILQLSADHPESSKNFDLKRAEQRLETCPLIASSQCKVVAPDAVFVDYTVRQPIAFLEDFENVAIDKEGYPFPFAPFFSPKNLPSLYLGVHDAAVEGERPQVQWNTPLFGKSFALGDALLKIVTAPEYRDQFHVRRIDVSNAFAESYGTRAIVLLTEDFLIQGQTHYILPRILRLSTKNYAQELANYLQLRTEWLERERQSLPRSSLEKGEITLKEKIIDLRIEQLAFVEG